MVSVPYSIAPTLSVSLSSTHFIFRSLNRYNFEILFSSRPKSEKEIEYVWTDDIALQDIS